MLPFITAQVLIASYAFLMGQKEAAYIKERQYYVPINSPFDDPFHAYGLMGRGVVLILASLFQASVLGYILSPIACGLLLWIVYDIVIGDEVYDKPFYLGATGKVDEWLLKKFGKDAGKRKVQIGLGLVGILNLLYLFV
jgi:hypothetical protein